MAHHWVGKLASSRGLPGGSRPQFLILAVVRSVSPSQLLVPGPRPSHCRTRVRPRASPPTTTRLLLSYIPSGIVDGMNGLLRDRVETPPADPYCAW